MNPWWMHGSVLQFQCTVGSSRTVNMFCGQNAQSRCEHTRTGSTQTSWVVSSSLGARDFIDRETVLPGNVHRCLSVQMSQGLQDDSSLGPAISMWISENLVPLISHVNNLIYKMWLRYLQPNTSSEEKVSNILQKKTLRLYSAVVETFISGKTFVRR